MSRKKRRKQEKLRIWGLPGGNSMVMGIQGEVRFLQVLHHAAGLSLAWLVPCNSSRVFSGWRCQGVGKEGKLETGKLDKVRLTGGGKDSRKRGKWGRAT